MATKLLKFVKNENLSKTMGENARNKCQKEYDTNTHMKKIIEILGDK